MGGHRILYRDHVTVPTEVLIGDPCLFGHRIISTVAHVEGSGQTPS